MQHKHWTAFIVLGGIWSASFLWIKIALNEVGPFTLVAFRVLFGVLFAGGAVFLQRKAWPRDWAGWFPFLLLGATSIAIPFVLITWGEISIDSAVAAILDATVPLFTIVLAHLFLQDDNNNKTGLKMEENFLILDHPLQIYFFSLVIFYNSTFHFL